MSTSARYHITFDSVGKGVMIIDRETGAIQYPICGKILAAYYYYLVERGQIDESQELLAESMAG